MTKTTDDKTLKFIRRAKEVHGNKYDYSRVVYINVKTKVSIICPKHGIFYKTPYKHIQRKQGCPVCTLEAKRKSTEEFIEELKRVYGNKLLYDKTKYVNVETPVIVTCPLHGDFEAHPKELLNGHGCKECKKEELRREREERFIKKAKEVHGNKFDYSKVNYIDSRTPVTIICKKHNIEFKQRPMLHLRGSTSCPLCLKEISNKNVGESVTQEEFLKRVKSIFGDSLDFSKSIYKGVEEKVVVTCPKHGDFVTTPRSLYKERGCKLCDKERDLERRKNEFIQKAREIHGGAYDYSKVNYVNNYTEVEIVCPIHGSFWQTPSNHITSKTGCPLCVREKNYLTKEDFIKKAREVHGDKYDYNKVDYKGINEEVLIYCKEHKGYFKQRPINHLTGFGCNVCANNKRYSKKEFIQKAKEVHGDKYDYSLVVYSNNKTPVDIICPIHGRFQRKPHEHIVLGLGCPKCIGSEGEKRISNILTDLGIEFKKEYTVPGYRYRYDFYLPGQNIFIEYHGKQHYEPVKYFGGEEFFKIQRKRDEHKKDIVDGLKGRLIVVPYTYYGYERIKDYLIIQLKKVYSYWLKDNNGSVKAFKTKKDIYDYYKIPKDIPLSKLFEYLENERKIIKMF